MGMLQCRFTRYGGNPVHCGDKRSVPARFAIGPRDVQAGNVSAYLFGKGNLGAKPMGGVVAVILRAIKQRKS